MTKKSLQKHTDLVHQTHQSLTPQQQHEQAILLEPFYERLIGMSFEQSNLAVEKCRDLCAEFGFTVKQEASTHRNIYVYCSREGLPDSLRNPKSNPQRKRPSKRCDCRWRVVLFENEKNKWEFRKSLNPEAGKHNHELMRPEEIERSWPKEVTDLICELARLRMTTQDIRARVREQFSQIHWNERRFYNRLSEERQKIKLRDSIERTHQLSELWSKVCMATAGNDDLFQFVKQELTMLFQSICETVQVDPETFPVPYVFKDNTDDEESDAPASPASNDNRGIQQQQQQQVSSNDSSNSIASNQSFDRQGARQPGSKSSQSVKNDTAPKGYISVEIPKQIYYIKIHNQRQLQETQLLKAQRRPRSMSEDQSSGEPSRKQARKGKSRQSPLYTSTDDRAATHSMQHSSIPLPPPPSLLSQPFNASRASNASSSSVSMSMTPPRQLQAQPPTTFVYSYDSHMTLDSSLNGYVNPAFQNNYTMPSSAPGTPGFNTSDMSFTFDPQRHSPIGRNSVESTNSNNSSSNNEPTIHPALHSNPMSHQHQQRVGSISPSHSIQPQPPSISNTPTTTASNNNNSNNSNNASNSNNNNGGGGGGNTTTNTSGNNTTSNSQLYSLSPTPMSVGKSSPQQTIGLPNVYNKNAMMSNTPSRSVLPSVDQPPYHHHHQHQHQHQHHHSHPHQQHPHHPQNMFTHQSSSPNHPHHHHHHANGNGADTILPLYPPASYEQQRSSQ